MPFPSQLRSCYDTVHSWHAYQEQICAVAHCDGKRLKFSEVEVTEGEEIAARCSSVGSLITSRHGELRHAPTTHRTNGGLRHIFEACLVTAQKSPCPPHILDGTKPEKVAFDVAPEYIDAFRA